MTGWERGWLVSCCNSAIATHVSLGVWPRLFAVVADRCPYLNIWGDNIWLEYYFVMVCVHFCGPHLFYKVRDIVRKAKKMFLVSSWVCFTCHFKLFVFILDWTKSLDRQQVGVCNTVEKTILLFILKLSASCDRLLDATSASVQAVSNATDVTNTNRATPTLNPLMICLSFLWDGRATVSG